MATDDDGDDLVPAGAARAFVRALRRVEEDGEVEDMAALFTPEAELHRLGGARTRTGQDGARTFWSEYRTQFDEIRSRFTHAGASEERVVLEWTARARLRGGPAVDYEGASVLDVADAEASRESLDGFRTYYDTAVFVTGPEGTSSPPTG